ncbi:Ion_trans_2 domain-containing protein [Bacillus sp. IT-79MI2]
MYGGRNREKATDNGFIYPIFHKIISLLFYINVVELIKWIAIKFVLFFHRHSSDTDYLNRKKRKARNIAVDIFICLKFIFIGFVWYQQINNVYVVAITIYLLLMNSFTYFYYHIWEEGAIKSSFATLHRTRRKFISLFQSFIYMILSYGYLFQIPFTSEFKWESSGATFSQAFLFSLSNTFPLSYNSVQALTELGHYIRASQVLLSFLFITIILTQSIPKATQSIPEENQ